MILQCSRCSWTRTLRTFNRILALWVLRVHHWQEHGGKQPEVVPDGKV